MYFSGVWSADFPEKKCGTTCLSNRCTVEGENQSEHKETKAKLLCYVMTHIQERQK